MKTKVKLDEHGRCPGEEMAEMLLNFVNVMGYDTEDLRERIYLDRKHSQEMGFWKS